MTLLSARFIQKEIASTGNTVTITAVARSTDSNEYREVTETDTDTDDVNCFIQILNEEDESVKQGESRAGDLVFWFDSDHESKCVQGNKITYDSKTFQMSDVRKFDVSGTTYLIEVRTQQV